MCRGGGIQLFTTDAMPAQASPRRGERRSTFAKTQKRKTRTRSDRSSAFLSEKTSHKAE